MMKVWIVPALHHARGTRSLHPLGMQELIVDRTIMVRESDGDVDAGIRLWWGNNSGITASGEVWAGAFLVPANGLNGQSGIATKLSSRSEAPSRDKEPKAAPHLPHLPQRNLFH
ncbi:hypothetical protein [Microvirga aerophila]|uniref:Uncharacterized protein n=1 Tax=Microvirga aerophila TaxID=670291 RepID=A0A512C0T6_9HYPH|nr:hypothetical protein [Microvirga aerophila]GEO17826.1 hypothetical protein MAE02_55220 [Microvirga aerophila]